MLLTVDKIDILITFVSETANKYFFVRKFKIVIKLLFFFQCFKYITPFWDHRYNNNFISLNIMNITNYLLLIYSKIK